MFRYRFADGGYDPDRYHEAFLTGNCHYSDLTSLPFDEQYSNLNRLSAMCHDPEVYYNPDAQAFVVAHTDSTDLTDELYPSIIQSTSSITPMQNNPLNPLNPYATKTHWVKVGRDPMEAAEEYVGRQGYSYSVGQRNTYLMRCLMMLNLYGVPQPEAERWALSHDGLTQREIMSVVRSCYRNTAKHGSFGMPWRWEENLQTYKLTAASHTHTRAREEANDVTELKVNSLPDYQWPRFIQQMVD